MFLHTAREVAVPASPPVPTAHSGRTTQVWDATVTDEASGKTIALFLCTQLLLDLLSAQHL
jgi:acyl-coenzyme A thioesterase PaaI-like protein